ncbi:MAG: IS21 family transposase [Lachnospiraceae bacterium]
MVDYREILRLKSLNYSNTDISASVHSSRNTVQEVLNIAGALKIKWPFDDEVTNYILESLLYPERHKQDDERLLPDYPKIHRELAKKGVTLTLLWTEYCMEAKSVGKKPYMSTQFGDNYRRWARVTKATMRIHHKPGDAMEVDWAGATIDIYDPVTGDVTPAYLFVAVLSCSCYVYAEACINMKEDTFIRCHIHAYEHFGGVTRLLIPDNLKTGVTRNTRYETIIPRAYKEMSDHYDTAILPARVEHPDDKPNAEGSVKFATIWILAALRNRHFFSIEEAKQAVYEKLEELNARPFQKRAGNRRLAYENEEKEFMLPLPAAPYEPAIWSTAKVQNDYLINDGINKYSVPFDLIGEQVDVRVTNETVEVFYRGSRVASHIRHKKAQLDPIRTKEHMPPEHQKYLAYAPEEFLLWADAVGESTKKVVSFFLSSGKEPEQGYKYCVSLMKTADRYGQLRMEMACERLLAFTTRPSLRSIVTILKNGQDKLPLEQPSDKMPRTERHSKGITRGAASFRIGGDTE